MKRLSAFLLLLACSIVCRAQGQQTPIWTDEMQIAFRGQPLSLGTSEQEFNRRYPGGFKSSVKTDLREIGSLPTVFVGGTWMLLDPELTFKIQFIMKNGDDREPGIFYFQSGKLVAMEIPRGIDSDDMEPVIFQTLISMSAQGRACSITGLKSSFNLYSSGGIANGEANDEEVRVTCGRHYLKMARTLMDYTLTKPMITHSFFEGLIDTSAKTIIIPQPENTSTSGK